MPTYAVTLGTLQILSNVPITKEMRDAARNAVKAELEKTAFKHNDLEITVRLVGLA